MPSFSLAFTMKRRNGPMLRGHGECSTALAPLLNGAVHSFGTERPSTIERGEHCARSHRRSLPYWSRSSSYRSPAGPQPRQSPRLGERHSGLQPEGPAASSSRPADSREAQALAPNAAPPVVGEQRTWLALDDAEGTLYPKVYTLRGIGEHIEVWVASDSDDISDGTKFPGEDCRNDRVRDLDHRRAASNYLIDQFDNLMYAIESAAFSVPPSLGTGTNAPLTDILDLPTTTTGVPATAS